MPTTAPYPKRWLAHVFLSMSLLVISLDNTILNVALPSIRDDLHAGSSQLSWIVDSYMLVFAGILLTAGSLADRFGRKRALIGGLAVFGVASTASAFMSSAGGLIATRSVMGLGAAFIMPVTLSIVTNMFPKEERPKAIGIWAAVAGLGIAIGPVSGGALLRSFDWSSVFVVNVPIVLVAIVGAIALVPDSKDPHATPLDPFGAVLSTGGLTALLWAIIEAPSRGWGDPGIVAAFAAAATLLVAFVRWELHTEHPMLDVRLFRMPTFSAAGGSLALAFFAMNGLIFFLTQYLQSVLGFDALESGIHMLPLAGGLILGGPIAMKLGARTGPRPLIVSGLLILAAGMVTFSFAGADSGESIVLLANLIVGVGMGLIAAPATESVMSSLPLAHAGVGSAMNDTVRLVGGALGVAILGSVLSSVYGGRMDDAVTGLPGPAADVARDSVGGADAVAAQIGGEQGHALVAQAHDAFVAGMQVTVLMGAGVAVAAAIMAARFLPHLSRTAEARAVVAEPVAA